MTGITTRNVMIEGDNLEVLKLLQKSYAGKVKLIYIDPPYNTGKDFIYPDDWHDNISNYLQLTGQADSAIGKLSSNPESGGRFHTRWLNMAYPRLMVARALLRPDGVFCISISETELSNLLRLCDEIYGEDNLVGIVTWKARVKPVNVGFARPRPQKETEYVVIYQRREHADSFVPLFSGGVRSYPHEMDGRAYRLATILKSNRGTSYRRTMSFSVDGYAPPEGQRWQGGVAEIQRLHREGYVEYRDGTPFRRYFEDEEDAEHDPFYCFMDGEKSATSEIGKAELNELLGNDHGFDTVKPTRLLRTLVAATTSPNGEDIVMDYFAGSGTMFDSVLRQNAEDGGNRRVVLVQVPELLEGENKDQRTAATYCEKIGKPANIAELTKERCRLAGRRIGDDLQTVGADIGFRVLKLDSSNIRVWDSMTEDLEGSLLAGLDHIRPGRTEKDILTELLLKLGLDLCVPVEERVVSMHEGPGKTVYSVGAGTLMACLEEVISVDDVERLGQGIVEWHEILGPAGETTVVFRDSAFADDVAKTNLAAILDQRGLGNVRSL